MRKSSSLIVGGLVGLLVCGSSVGYLSCQSARGEEGKQYVHNAIGLAGGVIASASLFMLLVGYGMRSDERRDYHSDGERRS